MGAFFSYIELATHFDCCIFNAILYTYLIYIDYEKSVQKST